MIRLYEYERYATSKNEALFLASNRTGFKKEDFKCEVLKEPKRVGLFKKEDGIYNCWYEYEGMDADREIRIVDARLYADIRQKKILVLRYGFLSYEIDYSDMTDYEILLNTSLNSITRTISSKNKALKGGILFGVTGAIVGAADSETITETETDEVGELRIKLEFQNKKPIEIITCNRECSLEADKWQDILQQSKAADEFFRELSENMQQKENGSLP